MQVEQHIRALEQTFVMTPYEDRRHAEQTMTAVSKMLLALPAREAGELAATAKGGAYMAALEDVPSWAVEEAMRRWYRGDCGAAHDYTWQPGSAVLREISMLEVYRVMAVRRALRETIDAEPLIEFTPEHETRMKTDLDSILKMRRA